MPEILIALQALIIAYDEGDIPALDDAISNAREVLTQHEARDKELKDFKEGHWPPPRWADWYNDFK